MAFLSARVELEYNFLFVVNRMVDLVFIMDMCLQFLLMYPKRSPLEGVTWIDDPRRIAWNYARTWLAVDLLAIFPSILDLITIANESAEQGSYDVVLMLRVVRIFRLVKMLRLLRASRIFKR